MKRPPKFGGLHPTKHTVDKSAVMGNGRAVSPFFDQVDYMTDPVRVVDVLRHLAADINALTKASLMCRILLGRHLVMIQKNELWRQIERRDYRTDPSGTQIWLKPTNRTYSSWYNFLEEGFERITGLHRQTAYSAIKLAHSSALSALGYDELMNFKRLANALELVAAERAGVQITPEILAQAQELPIKQFRQRVVRGGAVMTLRNSSTLGLITKFLRSAVAKDPNVLNDLWAIIEDTMARANQDPVRAVESLAAAYFSGKPHLAISPGREAQAS
jgi:hypothetical protein